MNGNGPTLPSNRAFVVQFRSTAEPASVVCAGRVEHLVSGQATRFESWERLQQFIIELLAQISEKPP
jgi:hypothetical protein